MISTPSCDFEGMTWPVEITVYDNSRYYMPEGSVMELEKAVELVNRYQTELGGKAV